MDLNSPLYSRDCLFYIGADKCKDLAANFRVGGDASIRKVLFDSMRFLASTDTRVPDMYRFRCLSSMQVPATAAADGSILCGECDASVSAGGDMAAGHAGFALDSPIARYGCCMYCWLKKEDWFEYDKCKTAVRRNLVLETCLAHLNPFMLYEGKGLPSRSTPPICPVSSCGAVLSEDFIAKEAREMEKMTVQQLTLHL
eukprot:3050035-Pleurochrysis_carterae.AAC.1